MGAGWLVVKKGPEHTQMLTPHQFMLTERRSAHNEKVYMFALYEWTRKTIGESEIWKTNTQRSSWGCDFRKHHECTFSYPSSKQKSSRSSWKKNHIGRETGGSVLDRVPSNCSVLVVYSCPFSKNFVHIALAYAWPLFWLSCQHFSGIFLTISRHITVMSASFW